MKLDGLHIFPLQKAHQLMSRLIMIVIFLLFYISSESSYASDISMADGRIIRNINITSWKDIRDSKIEKQDLDYSCGASSVATILRSFYGVDVNEKDIIDNLEKEGAASFHDLEKVVRKYNFKAEGYALSFEQLAGLKIPAITYLRYRDDDHFSVIRGISKEGLVWLGDPSWGNRRFSRQQFLSMWETREDDALKGKILVIVPNDINATSIKASFFGEPTTNKYAIDILKTRQF